jgi:transforming growth factor-beta-induced protein
MKHIIAIGLLLLLMPTVIPAQAQGNTILDVPRNDPELVDRLTIVLDAIEAAGLESTLRSGEYTLFAPTNGAFETVLRAEDIELGELLADTERLTDILRYHVVPGRVTYADLEDRAGLRNDAITAIRMLDGNVLEMQINANTDFVSLNRGQATITLADVSASNGVIHVVNNLMAPIPVSEAAQQALAVTGDLTSEGVADPDATEEVDAQGTPVAPVAALAPVVDVADLEEGTLAELVPQIDDLSTLTAAVEAAALEDLLADPNDDEEEDDIGFTLFAPTNDAFDSLLGGIEAVTDVRYTETDLLESAVLEDILLYHLSEGVVMAADFPELTRPLESLVVGGGIFTNVSGEGVVQLNGFVSVIQADIEATNGVMHIIDEVLLPESALEAFGF